MQSARRSLGMRCISVTSNIGKGFARILATRLSHVAKKQGWLLESQAGNRTGRTIENNIFILNTIMNQQQLSGTKLFVAFIDVKKAFNSVNRATLWSILEEKGVSGKFVRLLQSLYNTRRTIHWHSGVTTQILVATGVRQGCPLSPILFALLTSDIPDTLDQQSGNPIWRHHGYQPSPCRRHSPTSNDSP